MSEWELAITKKIIWKFFDDAHFEDTILCWDPDAMHMISGFSTGIDWPKVNNTSEYGAGVFTSGADDEKQNYNKINKTGIEP